MTTNPIEIISELIKAIETITTFSEYDGTRENAFIDGVGLNKYLEPALTMAKQFIAEQEKKNAGK